MKKILITLFLSISICLLIGWQYSETQKEEKAKLNTKLLVFEDLAETYRALLVDPYSFPPQFSILDSLEEKPQIINDHLNEIRLYIEKSLHELDTTNYAYIIRTQESKIDNLNTSLAELKERKLELESKNLLIMDSLEKTRRELNTQLAQKELALASTSKSRDSLNKVINNMEAEKKEVLKFKSPGGIDITYFGEVKDGKAHGQGIGVYANGNRYEGKWRQGKKHGEGTYSFPDGERYEGNFDTDRREGWGKYYWPNGDVYQGYWKNDRRHGEGYIKDKMGKVLSSGIWENDALTKMMKIDF